jgi:hypothetical protein
VALPAGGNRCRAASSFKMPYSSLAQIIVMTRDRSRAWLHKACGFDVVVVVQQTLQ